MQCITSGNLSSMSFPVVLYGQDTTWRYKCQWKARASLRCKLLPASPGLAILGVRFFEVWNASEEIMDQNLRGLEWYLYLLQMTQKEWKHNMNQSNKTTTTATATTTTSHWNSNCLLRNKSLHILSNCLTQLQPARCHVANSILGVHENRNKTHPNKQPGIAEFPCIACKICRQNHGAMQINATKALLVLSPIHPIGYLSRLQATRHVGIL